MRYNEVTYTIYLITRGEWMFVKGKYCSFHSLPPPGFPEVSSIRQPTRNGRTDSRVDRAPTAEARAKPGPAPLWPDVPTTAPWQRGTGARLTQVFTPTCPHPQVSTRAREEAPQEVWSTRPDLLRHLNCRTLRQRTAKKSPDPGSAPHCVTAAVKHSDSCPTNPPKAM